MNDISPLLDDPVPGLGHPDPAIRRLAVSLLAEAPEHIDGVTGLLSDPDPRVRAEAAEVLGGFGNEAVAPLRRAASTESHDVVVEAIAHAFGELADREAVPWLIALAGGDGPATVRETAVAALGAIGDEAALDVLLSLSRRAPPQVRRRCVVALTVFDGVEAEAAIREALSDRNPMVREAAEMAVGRPLE